MPAKTGDEGVLDYYPHPPPSQAGTRTANHTQGWYQRGVGSYNFHLHGVVMRSSDRFSRDNMGNMDSPFQPGYNRMLILSPLWWHERKPWGDIRFDHHSGVMRLPLPLWHQWRLGEESNEILMPCLPGSIGGGLIRSQNPQSCLAVSRNPTFKCQQRQNRESGLLHLPSRNEAMAPLDPFREVAK